VRDVAISSGSFMNCVGGSAAAFECTNQSVNLNYWSLAAGCCASIRAVCLNCLWLCVCLCVCVCGRGAVCVCFLIDRARPQRRADLQHPPRQRQCVGQGEVAQREQKLSTCCWRSAILLSDHRRWVSVLSVRRGVAIIRAGWTVTRPAPTARRMRPTCRPAPRAASTRAAKASHRGRHRPGPRAT
jgi:hypothetical protein